MEDRIVELQHQSQTGRGVLEVKIQKWYSFHEDTAKDLTMGMGWWLRMIWGENVGSKKVKTQAGQYDE